MRITFSDILMMMQGKPETKSEQKPAEPSKKRRKSVNGNATEDEDNSLESFDWWTKYHASKDFATEVSINRSSIQYLSDLHGVNSCQ
jgi:hypothetical protein